MHFWSEGPVPNLDTQKWVILEKILNLFQFKIGEISIKLMRDCSLWGTFKAPSPTGMLVHGIMNLTSNNCAGAQGCSGKCLQFSQPHSPTTLGQCRIKELLFHLSPLVFLFPALSPSQRLMDSEWLYVYRCRTSQELVYLLSSSAKKD